MSTIKFTSKQLIYTLQNGFESTIENPFIEPDAAMINYRNQTLRIPFSMYRINSEGIKVTIPKVKGEVNFTHVNQISTVNIEGTEVEVMQALQGGWAYNADEITWGNPDFIRAMNFFNITASGLQFKDVPEKQLAIDFILNKVIIEGKLLKENFELEIIN